MAALALELRALGAEVRVCAPADEEFAKLLDRIGVQLVPVGPSARALTTQAPPPSAANLPQRAAAVLASQLEGVTAAAEGCDLVMATGMISAAAGALSVAEKLGIPAVSVTFQQLTLPSPLRRPLAYPGRPLPTDVTDNRVLWKLDAENINALFGEALNSSRASIGLPPVDDVRDYVIGDRPWLATDPVLDPWQETADFDVVRTGAWVMPDERPLPDDLVAFLEAGEPPVFVGFGSMPMRESTDVVEVAVEAVRAQGRRVLVGRGWADLSLIDGQDDCFAVGDTNHQALFPGSPPSCTTAVRAPRRRPPGPACPRCWCPSSRTSRTGRAGWPNWASARHTTVRPRPSRPCPPRSAPPWPPRPASGPGPWATPSAPTGRRSPRSSSSTSSARESPPCPPEPGRPPDPPGRSAPFTVHHGHTRPHIGADHLNTLPTRAFDLPDRLSSKAAPALIAGDEQHFAALAECLEQSIAEVSGQLDAARRAPGGMGRHAMDRDTEIHRLTARLRTLRRFGLDLCLGHMVSADDSEPLYVGRLGLTDSSGRRLLVDWRSPAAEPFFGATHGNPMGLTSRRRYRWTGGRISDYWDEVFTADGLEHHAALDDQSAFIASLGSNRSPRMRDVLGTIQADQDAIIRAGSRGALVVDGGPGTGKTVVALHRSAYLLHSDPRLGHRRGGVLFVGPHRPYLSYVSDVLPSLGEEGVQTCILRDLVAEGAAAGIEADPEAARLKSSAELVGAIEKAVRFYEEPPAKGMTVTTHWSDIPLSADEWAVAFDAAEPGTAHNEARDQVWEELLTILIDKHEGDVSPELLRKSLRQNRELRTTFDRAWPLLEAADIVGDLWTVPAYLRMCAPGSPPTRCAFSSARRPRPGRCPTCRSWTRPGSGSATRRRPAARSGTRPPSPSSAST